jgi:hypothetical protein
MRTKRIEYEGTLYEIKDESLDKEIEKKTRSFIEDIFNGAGKEYIIPDLELLITQQIKIAVADFCCKEAFEIMCKTKGGEENEI